MEIDSHLSYIFGSFSRRRHQVGKARSHERSSSTPHHPNKFITTKQHQRTQSEVTCIADDNKFKCPMCRRYFVEPRVLPCLHTFCTKCLKDLEVNAFISNQSNGSNDSNKRVFGSGCSGYTSDKGEQADKFFSCPLCGTRSNLSPEGVLALPPHYLLQNRMVLATVNSCNTRLLCDICETDQTATYRCNECVANLCMECANESHGREKRYQGHEVLQLQEARRRGIRKVRRQIMCYVHSDHELSMFCSTCSQVLCTECATDFHQGHVCETATHAAKCHASDMRDALENVRHAAKCTASLTSKLQGVSRSIQENCNQVEKELLDFIDAYAQSVQDHCRNLMGQLNRARKEKLRAIERQQLELQVRLKSAKDAVIFVDELLNEGTDVEVLSYVVPVMKKLKHCSESSTFPGEYLKTVGDLKFLPDEQGDVKGAVCPLYGALTTQTVSPEQSILHSEGLQNLKIGRRAEVIFETKDGDGTRLRCGGELVAAELCHRDAGASQTLPVRIADLGDGTYRLSFTPDVAGKLLLSITLEGQHVKDSPFVVLVQKSRRHHGTYHCCSFCSSEGSKEAACGCGSKIPGGYRGCGHGHDGHPGRRHWSCCGNVLELSECVRAGSTHYQFTL